MRAESKTLRRLIFSKMKHFVAVVLILPATFGTEKPTIRARPDELWCVTFPEGSVASAWRVSFGRNGYFVVEKYEPSTTELRFIDEKQFPRQLISASTDSHWRALMDGDCMFWGGWGERFGMRLRRVSGDKGACNADIAAGRLTFEDELFESQLNQWNQIFRYKQTVEVQPDSLRLIYEMNLLKRLDADTVGLISICRYLASGKSGSVYFQAFRALYCPVPSEPDFC